MPALAQRWAGRVAVGGHLLRQGPYDLGPVQGWLAAQQEVEEVHLLCLQLTSL